MEDSLFQEDLLSNEAKSKQIEVDDRKLSAVLKWYYNTVFNVAANIRDGVYMNIRKDSILSDLISSNLLNVLNPLVRYIYQLEKDGK